MTSIVRAVCLVDFIDVTPRQVIRRQRPDSFLAHDEGNRSLMGSNMQCQSVPLMSRISIVGTGWKQKLLGNGRVIYLTCRFS